MLLITFAGWLSVLGWCYLAFWHSHFWEPLLPDIAPTPDEWPSVDIIVPARNEADILPHTLPSLLEQNYLGAWRVILVNDHSDDSTKDVAETLAEEKYEKLLVVDAPDLPPGWSGKVAAMHTGLTYSDADFVLFTDADIAHHVDSLQQLVSRAIYRDLALVSLMVRLRCESRAEKFLIPAFVFFFAMLFPFRKTNDPQSSAAAAAGGVMLVKRAALDAVGGLECIKSALIDDCALANALKNDARTKGIRGRIALTLTQDVVSLRPYPQIEDVRNMISRTAYTQLRHSPLLLGGTVMGMFVLYVLPILLFLSCMGTISLTGFAVWALMSVLYMPTVLFYGLNPLWAFTLPFAAMVYTGATIDSARKYYEGKGGQWKGRSQV